MDDIIYEIFEEPEKPTVLDYLGTALTVAWWVFLAVLPGVVLAWFFR